ncbi:hypothetical protein P7C71_g783, partial [Lecanoromycetidae sp. Uapishka_2]
MDKELGYQPAIGKIKINVVTALLRGIGPDGKEFTIGALKTAQSPQCNVQVKLTGHETQSFVQIRLRFPRLKTKVTEHAGETQNISLNFYADAFNNIDEDFTVNMVDELPSFLADDDFAKQSMTRKKLSRFTLRYKPSRIVGEGVENTEQFSHPDSAADATNARHLLDQTSSKVDVFVVVTGVKWLKVLKDHMKTELNVIPLGQYYGRNSGKPVIQWGVGGYGPEIDRKTAVPVQYRFRDAEQHAITYGYAEMREAGPTIEAALKTLQISVPISLVEVPGYVYKNGMPIYYVGFMNLPDIDAVQHLFSVGAKGAACFEKPKEGVQPSGWDFEVQSSLPNVEHYGELTLQLKRPERDSTEMKVARRPNSDMLEESNHEVWVIPEISDLAAKRLVDCAAKLLNHNPNMDELRRLAQARDLRESESHGIFEGLSEEQREHIKVLTEVLTDDQREAFEHITAVKHLIALVQGGPGTGKSEIACLLIRVFHYLDMPVLALAPTNVAIDVIGSKLNAIAPEINAMRFHSLTTEFSAIYRSFNNLHDAWEDDEYPTSKKVKTSIAAERDQAQRVWLEVIADACNNESSGIATKDARPNLECMGIYVRALERAGIMVNGRILPEAPTNVPEIMREFVEMFYKAPELKNIATQSTEPKVKHQNTTEGNSKDASGNDNFVAPWEDENDDAPTDDPATLGSETTKVLEDTIRSMKVILATCNNSADNTLRKCFKPKVIVIDDAAKGKELELLLALVHNIESVILVVYLGDPLQLPPTVTSRFLTVKNIKDGQPVNVFAKQLMLSHMTRLYQIGYETVVLREQHRMVEGTAIGSSELRYKGVTTYSPRTSLSSRPQAQQALQFIREKFNLDTKAPHVCLSVTQGITIRGATHSRRNLHNIVVDLNIVEEVIRRQIFAPAEITICTPYKDQAAAIRAAIVCGTKKSEFWRTFDARAIKVFTTDSMQGAENSLVIFDTVLANKRRGAFGFVDYAGRLNVGCSRHKNMFVLVCDIKCEEADEILAEDSDDDKDLELDPNPIQKEKLNRFKDLLGIYARARVVTESVNPRTLSQAKFVDLKGAEKWWADVNAPFRKV